LIVVVNPSALVVVVAVFFVKFCKDVAGFGLSFSVHGVCSCGRDNSRTCPPVTGQALALSSCGDGDYPSGDAVGLLGFGSVGSESDDLAAVGALAQCTNGARHVVCGLCGANQNGAALWCGAVLWRVHWHNHSHWQTMGGESVGLLYVISAEIHGKTPLCGVLGPLDGLGAVLVCVGKPGSASVRFDDLAQCEGVHLFTVSG
jgi:hypothetical protein